MLKIEVGLVSLYRKFIPSPKIIVEIEEVIDGKETTVYDLVKQVANSAGQEMIDMLYLEDGTIDDWSRVLLNGRDIRFLSEDEKILQDKDSVYIFSISAGG